MVDVVDAYSIFAYCFPNASCHDDDSPWVIVVVVVVVDDVEDPLDQDLVAYS